MPPVRVRLEGLSGEVVVDEAALDTLADRLAERLPGRADDEPWIDADAAAEHMACRPKRIYDLVALNELPHARDGRRLLFRRSELDEYLRGPQPWRFSR